ncbi:hydrolase NUDIX family protein [Firmicutes bacterium CAG:884]|nr:NUDIX domain-containing protein [Bacillota bacterium]CCY94399.1 hydrolase NUDIX family protein [Firmicutes bacterium CAG:884]
MNKAGCILINKELKKIGLVYRKKLNDYSFPKGHLEENETLSECAVRETTEETGRDCKLISDKEIGVIEYTNYEGQIKTYMFLALDKGKTNKKIAEKDKEELVWVNYNEVESKLSYQNLKDFWNKVKEKVEKI